MLLCQLIHSSILKSTGYWWPPGHFYWSFLWGKWPCSKLSSWFSSCYSYLPMRLVMFHYNVQLFDVDTWMIPSCIIHSHGKNLDWEKNTNLIIEQFVPVDFILESSKCSSFYNIYLSKIFPCTVVMSQNSQVICKLNWRSGHLDNQNRWLVSGCPYYTVHSIFNLSILIIDSFCILKIFWDYKSYPLVKGWIF